MKHDEFNILELKVLQKDIVNILQEYQHYYLVSCHSHVIHECKMYENILKKLQYKLDKQCHDSKLKFQIHTLG